MTKKKIRIFLNHTRLHRLGSGLGGLLLGGLVLVPGPVYAQKISTAQLKRAVGPSSRVELLSRQAAQRFRRQVQTLVQPTTWAHPTEIVHQFPATQRAQVFQVQQTSFARSTASAFALEIDGKVWGVTASHVMHNIEREPYLLVENEYGKRTPIAITDWVRANQENADVAVFKIPPEALPYIQILKPAPALPDPRTELQLQGYVQGNPLMTREPVLFAGPRGILLLDQTHREMTGFCGSPLLQDGKVAAVSIGSDPKSGLSGKAWFEVLREHVSNPLPSLHRAVPIQTVQELVAQWASRGRDPRGQVPVKVFGHFVTFLHPQLRISYLQQLRNGYVLQTRMPGPLLDPEHLEQFFEFKEGDVLRVVLQLPRQSAVPATQFMYDVDVSTGQVTKLEN